MGCLSHQLGQILSINSLLGYKLSARWQDPQAGLSVSVGIDNINDEEYSIFGDYQVNFGSDGEATEADNGTHAGLFLLAKTIARGEYSSDNPVL